MDWDELWPGGPRLRRRPGVFALGTDAVLLADFAAPAGAGTMLDLGCGGGVIPLLLAWNAPGLVGRGMDILPEAVENARENAALNGLEARLDFFCADLRSCRALGGAGSYDLVTANPPYFPVGSGRSAAGSAALARQEHGCTLADVCAAAGYYTRWGGRFAMVHRPERLAEAVRALSAAGLELKRLRFVQNRAESAPSLVLLEARRGANPGLTAEPPLLLTGPGGGDSEELRRIYHRARQEGEYGR